MFKQAGNGLLVFCDYDARLLRVGTDTPRIPGFNKELREIASFGSHEEWEKSQYCDQITNEDVLDTVAWFWHDLENPN